MTATGRHKGPPSATAPRPASSWIEAGWLLAATAVPLAMNWHAVQPFDPFKAALLRTLAGCMAALWLADCIIRGRSPWREVRDHPLLLPAVGITAAFLLATLLAPDWRLSLWGSYERGQGLATQLGYLFLFLVVAARLRTAAQARRLLGVMVATAVPLAVLGAAQAAGWRIEDFISDARSPVHGTLGRSNFLAAYLALLLPLTLALAAAVQRRTARLALVALALSEAGVLALTLARAGWLAAATGLAVLGLLLAPWDRLRPGAWSPRRARQGAAVLLFGGVLAAAGLALWLERSAGSGAARLSIWRGTLDLVVRRPFTGWGPDGLGLAFPQVYPPGLVYYQGRGVMVDRAHNLALDWLAAAGVLGLLACLLFFYVFFRAGVRGLDQQGDPARRVLLAGCLAAVAAALAGNLLAFDVTATATATWLLAALLPALARDRPPDMASILRPPDAIGHRRRIAALLVSPLLVAVVALGTRPVLADVSARAAALQAEHGDMAGAVAAYERAITLWPAEPAYRLSLAWVWLRAGERAAVDARLYLARAEAELLAARDLRPGDFRSWAALGELYGVWGNTEDPARLVEAYEAFARAASLAPNNGTIYTAWAMVDLEGNRFAAATGRLRRAVELDETDGRAFAHLGDAELALGHAQEALRAYRQAIRWEPGLAGAHLGLARCYLKLGQQRAASHAVDQALALEPDNLGALGLYRQIGVP